MYDSYDIYTDVSTKDEEVSKISKTLWFVKIGIAKEVVKIISRLRFNHSLI